MQRRSQLSEAESMNHRMVFLAGFLALLTSAAPPANAWGCKGHQTVALIAEKHLTAEGRQMVQKLLGDNPIDLKLRRWCGNATTDLIVDASTWPDDMRNERNNGPWHYIDIPRGKHNGSLEPFCGTEGCVTRAIEEQRAILKDKSADPLKRAEAIRYLIHFVGDLHQPLHAINNADNGGNCVAVKYFHHEALSNPHRYADELDEKFRVESATWEAAGIRVDNWAWESHERAESAVYDAFPEKIGIEPDLKLKSCAENNHMGKRMFERHLAVGEAYQVSAAKAAETGLAEAGVRLAMILNDAAKTNP